MALAISINCLSPPDIFMHPLSASLSIPSLSRAFMALALSFSPGTEKRPIWFVSPMDTLSRTLWLNTGLEDWGIYAMYLESSLPLILATSLPSISIFPLLKGRKPRIHLKKVLFPTPLGPSTAIASPPKEEKETFFNTLFSP